jgi:hypothetical protein
MGGRGLALQVLTRHMPIWFPSLSVPTKSLLKCLPPVQWPLFSIRFACTMGCTPTSTRGLRELSSTTAGRHIDVFLKDKKVDRGFTMRFEVRTDLC